MSSMNQELPPIILKGKELIKYRRLKRKYPVSRRFLHQNWNKVKRFILYALTPRCVIRNYAWRRRRRNSVLILRRVRILLFDPRLKRMIVRRKHNIKQWSKNIVFYYKQMGLIEEYEETELYDVAEPLGAEELTKQMKQQLELLKSGKRGISLIEDANKNVEILSEETGDDKFSEEDKLNDHQEEEKRKEQEVDQEKKQIQDELKQHSEEKDDHQHESEQEEILKSSKINEETTPTKSQTKSSPLGKVPPTPSKEQGSSICSSTEKSEVAGGSKFLDMLISKVRVKNFAHESNIPTEEFSPVRGFQVEEDNIGEDFVGFDESVHQPGMLLTPLVPPSCKTVDGNSAFVSDSLDAYMRKHHINDDMDKEKLLEPMWQDGQVTPHSMAPVMDMPAVPEALQRLRTVAERRHYLQRSKNQKMAIINNEANIYRELQRKQRQRKVKTGAMQLLQGRNTQMPFTRQGWQAASYVATEEFNYYYQVMQIDGEIVRLPGAQGNNLVREKLPYRSKLSPEESATLQCNNHCVDAILGNEFKIVSTKMAKSSNQKRLNQFPLPAIFRPCPLSKKPLQKPLDDDTAALLLAGGSMAVVSMPTVQLEVMPQLGRPLNEIAKRYLQHILPHHDITREWAEFSVSTLLEPPGCMREAEERASRTPAGRRKSFTFVIPYLNDRNHILVRRVVDRSEQMDESFHQTPDELQQFEFRKMLPESPPEDLLECANMITDMINTVAISCSENSFIREDPDALNGDAAHTTPQPSPTKEDALKEGGSGTDKSGGKPKRRPNKKKRLANELRRLNATIIDADAANEDANKPCGKPHCVLGCLCASLAGTDLPIRDHCAQAECVLDCRCLSGEQSRVMRVETADGRCISNEDAFNLRRKATARLAKMEKDFTSTLVLTENETLLINESQGDKKRRCTKAPKRYEDFDDESKMDESLNKSLLRSAAVKPVVKRIVGRHSDISNDLPNVNSILNGQICMVKDQDFAQLKHCFVGLRRLPDVDNLATFCMTHQLYKCFCGGDSTEGKPVVIEKEKSDAIVTHFNPELAVRAHYSFERPPEPEHQPFQPKKKRKEKQQKPPKDELQQQVQIQQPNHMPQQPHHQQVVNHLEKKQNERHPPIQQEPPIKESQSKSKLEIKKEEESTKYESPAPSSLPPTRPPLQRSNELDIIFSYFRSRPYLCRRAVSVPRNCYLRINRRRAQIVRNMVAKDETPEVQQLLTERIHGAVSFYRKALDQQRRHELDQKQMKPFIHDHSQVIVVRDDSDEGQPTNAVNSLLKRKNEEENTAATSSSIKRLKSSTVSKTDEKMDNILDIQMPKIAACYSLNSASVDVLNSGMNSAAAAAAVAAAEGGDVGDMDGNIDEDVNESSNFRAFYNEVVKNMNTLVSKKMQDIDLALQRESKVIPIPNEEILCIIKWTNFLAAFESNYVFIWDVQMKNYNFLAATTTNMMPSVCGAIGVVNTRFAPDPQALPVMARMLMEGKANENTRRLAVVMQGRKNYWLVKGFLRHMEGNACTKPTPQTHPLLTKKINVLCSLLVKQRIREHQRKMQSQGLEDSAGVNEASVGALPSMEAAPLTLPTLTGPGAVTNRNGTQIVPAPSLDVAPSAPNEGASNSSQLKDSSHKIRSNIEFRKVHHGDVDELQIPELHTNDHRWVVLDLYDDFSHIYVPAFRDMISLDRIHNVMRVSNEKQKVVKLQFFQDAPYDAFVTPSSRRKIYFGPLRLDMKPPVLVLLQSVDGKMMLREVYQKTHSIPVQINRRSMAFWVLHVNGQVHVEIDLESSVKLEAQSKGTTSVAPAPGTSKEQTNSSSLNVSNPNDAVVIIDSDEEEEESRSPPIKKEDLGNNAEPEIPRINFTITTMPNNGGLKITPSIMTASGSVTNLPATMASKDPLTPNFPSGFVPFIAKMPAKPGQSPTSPQFLNPQVQLTKTQVSGGDSASSGPPPSKVSRIAGAQNAKINESLQELLSSGNPTTSGGITITKVGKTAVSPTQESIKIGYKRTSSGVTKAPATTVTPKALATATSKKTTAAGGSGPAPIIKQSDKNLSIGNLPKRVHPPPPSTAAGGVKGVRLVPKANPAAARQSLPNNPVVKEQQITGGRKSVPSKLPLGQSLAKKKCPMNANRDLISGKPTTPDANGISPAAAPTAGPSRKSLPVKVGPPSTTQIDKPASSRKSLPGLGGTSNLSPPSSSDDSRPCYGFLTAKGLPRYRVKLLNSEYMVKMPDLGVLIFKNLTLASNFINRQLARNSELEPLLPGNWQFLPLDANRVQQQRQQSPSLIDNPGLNRSSSSSTPAIVIED